MTLKKGDIINPSGRPKGAANKTTSEIRAAFQQLVSNNIDKLQDDIEKLKPEQRISFILKMAEFLLPKLQSLSIQNQIELEYKQLEALLNNATPEAIEAITAKILTLKIQNNETEN